MGGGVFFMTEHCDLHSSIVMTAIIHNYYFGKPVYGKKVVFRTIHDLV